MRIYLVRHGETTYNRDGLGLGRDDVPLTDLGLEQARRTCEYFQSHHVDAIYTSPLERAAAFARAMCRDGEPVITDALLELDVGETEGMPFGEMRKRYPDFLRLWAGADAPTAVMPGGESLADVDARVTPFLNRLREGDAGSVALVTHNFVIRVILCRLVGLPLTAFRSFAVDLASVSIIDADGGRATILRLNDICHVQGLEP